MAKIRLHIDPKGIAKKPTGNEWGRISQRVLKSTSITEVTVRQLAQKIETGHTICPAVLNGSKAADWREQQVFMVDIDNADKNLPQLSEEQAVEICDEHGLPLAMYYQTFGYSEDHPKFRLVFILDSVVTEPSLRRMIMERLISIFPQSDKACANANRLFLGTNKEVVLHSKNARVAVEQILALPCDPSSTDGQSSKVSVSQEIRNDSELAAQIRSFDFFPIWPNGMGHTLGVEILSASKTVRFADTKTICATIGTPTHFTVFLQAVKWAGQSLTI